MEKLSGRAGIHHAVRDSKAVLFDFDFTLADSSVGIIACINYALTRIGLPESPPEDILKTIGLYIPEALVALAGEEYRPSGEEFFKFFTEKADEVMADGTYLYPGASKTLPALDELGYLVGIVSTKYRYRIESMMDRDGLLDRLGRHNWRRGRHPAQARPRGPDKGRGGTWRRNRGLRVCGR